MRRELKEYPFDWSVERILNIASRLENASDKEFAALKSVAPNYRGVLDALLEYRTAGSMFFRVSAEYFREVLTAHERGKKICLISFAHPPEICYALDIVPMIPEVMTSFGTLMWSAGVTDFQDFCTEVGLTDTSCAAQRGGVGGILSGMVVKPDMVVNNLPGICDTNSTVAAFTAEYLDVPYLQLDQPADIDTERSRAYHHKDFRRMIEFLEEQSGNRLDEDRLREVCKHSIRADEAIMELQELRTAVPNPVPNIFGAMEFGSKYLNGGTDRCTRVMDLLVKSARERYEQGLSEGGEERARGVFIYVSHFTHNARFWTWLAENGITHLGEMLNSFSQVGAPFNYSPAGQGYSIDTTNLDTMIDSLSDQLAWYPMVKNIRGPYDAPGQWLDDTMAWCNTFHADFICYIGTMSCRNSWGVTKLIMREVEERLGIPGIILYADAWDDRIMSWEACQDRLDEFLSMRVFS